MSTDNRKKYTHYTSAKGERKNHCDSVQEEKCNYALDTKTRSGGENEELQSVTTLVTEDITNVSEVCLDDSKQSADLPLTPEGVPIPKCSEHNALSVDSSDLKKCDQASDCGLLRYRKWWERIEVDISVYGKLITGVPIFIEDNTLRVVNKNYSYFIPLEKVDYIRTTDGLRPCFDSSDDSLAE